jgi:RNA polymerase sigma-70 factor, ECF subfamily
MDKTGLMTNIEKQEKFMSMLEPLMSKLSGFAKAMTRDGEYAKDLVGETILIAYKNFENIKDKSAFPGYIFTVASRHFKRTRWRSRFFGRWDEDRAEEIPADVKSPDSNLDVEFLYHHLDKLPVKMKEALVLFEISGLTLDEVRKIQGGTISGVKSRLKRGREKLAVLMNDDYSNLTNQKKIKSLVPDAEIKIPQRTNGYKNGNGTNNLIYQVHYKVNADE